MVVQPRRAARAKKDGLAASEQVDEKRKRYPPHGGELAPLVFETGGRPSDGSPIGGVIGIANLLAGELLPALVAPAGRFPRDAGTLGGRGHRSPDGRRWTSRRGSVPVGVLQDGACLPHSCCPRSGHERMSRHSCEEVRPRCLHRHRHQGRPRRREQRVIRRRRS